MKICVLLMCGGQISEHTGGKPRISNYVGEKTQSGGKKLGGVTYISKKESGEGYGTSQNRGGRNLKESYEFRSREK